MSLNDMTKIGAAKRISVVVPPAMREDLQLASAAPPGPFHVDLGVAATLPTQATTASATSTTPQGTALDAVVAYIPTEIVATYVAILATFSLSTPSGSLSRWVVFWVFLALTPLTTWVMFATNYKAQFYATYQKNPSRLPWKPREWPWWEFFSATLAFAVWSYALPKSPFARFSWYQPAVGTAGILFVSFILGLLAPLIRQPSSASAPT